MRFSELRAKRGGEGRGETTSQAPGAPQQEGASQGSATMKKATAQAPRSLAP